MMLDRIVEAAACQPDIRVPLRSSPIVLVHINLPSISSAPAEPRPFDLARAIASISTFSLLLRRLDPPQHREGQTAHGARRIRRAVDEPAYGAPWRPGAVCLVLEIFGLFKDRDNCRGRHISVPERIGGDKNYDYRYAWVRDAAYTIKALLRAGALQEPVGAFGWLVRTIAGDGPEPKVVYTLSGGEVPRERMVNVPGYKGWTPVRIGNRARAQTQLSCYGDVLETAALFARSGHVLDPQAARLLENLAEQCVRR